MKDNFVFFGTPEPAVIVLEQLKKVGLFPTHIVTNPDRPAGRGLAMQASPAKIWGEENIIPVLTPEKMDGNFIKNLEEINPALCIVVAYGKILKKEILDIPEKGFLNVHPSLLPLHRGATPIQSCILSGDKETGVTVMQLDEKMDHGPIVAQEFLELQGNELSPDLHKKLFEIGGDLLAEAIPEYIAGNIDLQDQDDELATYAEKIEKKDGEILESDTDEIKWQKYRAYYGWPGVFYFNNDRRVKISSARFEKEKFIIERIIPEGKKEQEYKKSA
ncbi:methionyl-tRNA formyltransferase [Candidatus Parcubacteria bacterium]|nr:methionyl-tRNA formyltransferase [Candidatus Parcubacteria bacterium]